MLISLNAWMQINNFETICLPLSSFLPLYIFLFTFFFLCCSQWIIHFAVPYENKIQYSEYRRQFIHCDRCRRRRHTFHLQFTAYSHGYRIWLCNFLPVHLNRSPPSLSRSLSLHVLYNFLCALKSKLYV